MWVAAIHIFFRVASISRGQASNLARTEWHLLRYMPGAERANMQRQAKVFMSNRSQAVRLPKEFQFPTNEVFIRKEGSEVVLSPRPCDSNIAACGGVGCLSEFHGGYRRSAGAGA